MQTYTLKHPITRTLRVNGGPSQDQTIGEISVRRINGGDMRWLEKTKGQVGQSLDLIGRLTEWDRDLVDRLDAEDVAGISEVIEGFLPPSLRDGKGSSET